MKKPPLLSIPQLAKMARRSPRGLREAAQRGRLKAERLGRDWFTTVQNLDAYLAGRWPKIESKARTRAADVYLCSNAAGRLIYVGMSLTPPFRLRSHKGAHWWQEVAAISVEHFPTRIEAALREKELIKKSQPIHNKEGKV